MKITGKKSLLWWLRYPFGVYIVIFAIASLWILSLIILYFFTEETNRFISLESLKNPGSSIAVQFHYPFTSMALTTKNTYQSLLLAFLGLISINFILLTTFRIILELSQDNFFTDKAIKNFKILGFGLLAFGVIQGFINILISPQQPDLIQPFVFLITGFSLILMKEVFLKGKKMQDESDLVI
ncbi:MULTISPECIES: DUF2975 domain-containing protein [Chryseobacterium]|uniref:DUF2975 domain-containing protein n=1 Tax=Chryseobacterium camelliae TaxID=1265445 RepID=A0ABU0TN84_9FLAO|nr:MULTISPECIES: DUF2975 domain-containing protein [Chryseobacterium]MDT3408383.1 hypothetical protein [Pseudacidovorax intermedius]MDQ1097760.1 hypothetical protein [Chryseobacterium camelliae]MDQ1101694.1 hypothetical protein [Chryseobacterium sp. SORGH_AS_1048]MDR6085132.1 hypothetical protein [Chryseobacterium sp. SORGH_AS_0909]MDR6129490.1 hypothetical protein [Chryseobacterium sp. SORGH_AS_1175]